MAEITPMMRQYRRIKEQNQDCILFFRLGDFYEMFDSDAKTAAKELDLVLTTRDRAKENPEERIPMCGVPYHSSEAYIARLIAKGYKVAICEQVEDPATAKGLVDRDIVRIVTPGTLIESSMLDEGSSNYLCSICVSQNGSAVCFADMSTGEICVSEFSENSINHLQNEISAYSPAEAILNITAAESRELEIFLTEKMHCLMQQKDELFDGQMSEDIVCAQFGLEDCGELGIRSEALRAVGALIKYIINTQKTDISHISKLEIRAGGQYMELDIQTLRNLELVSTMWASEKKGSLLWVLDRTKTSMGRRLIRSWVSKPLLSPVSIKKRLTAVDELYRNNIARSELVLALREISDIERLIGKIVYGSANCRDLKALSSSIKYLPQLARELKTMKGERLSELAGADMLSDIYELIEKTVDDEPPFSVREGGMIKSGVDPEVDRLRGLLGNSAAALIDIETKERARTGKKLKVGYNKVFGYYIEIPRSSSENVPDDYMRKQTLANSERFITQELKELEVELLTAKDRLTALEYKLFTQLREEISAHVGRIQNTAAAVAEIDVFCSLAEVAVQNGYCMPEIDMDGVIDIRDGRHPVVEQMQKDIMFVPNDAFLDNKTQTAIITGPNMAGKSTYMRQTALIVLMAQMGSFVPAKAAHISVVDRVFTRIGASDDLAGGKSTFMVEMTEVSEILKNATQRSLLILDEIGRGTSTYDGMAIARAVLEYCQKKIGAKTLFATHYHELTVLEDEMPGILNYNISAKKRGNDIIFLRKIVRGGADDSYGIEVAGLAGVPESVIKRAKSLLQLFVDGEAAGSLKEKYIPEERDDQISLLDMGGNEIVEILKKIDMNTITPIEAMNLLFELKKKVQAGGQR